MKKTLVFCIILFFLAGGLVWAQEIGFVKYIEGSVTITRNGEFLSGSSVGVGQSIENYDLIETDSDGYILIETEKSSGISAEISVNNSSSFYVEYSDLGSGNTRGGMDLLSGTVSLTVSKLSGKSSVDVRTESAVMGVRGTEFTVATAGEGDLLVTCEEGSVECASESGETVYAKPGQAAEKTADDLIRSIPVSVSDLKTFRKNWIAKRVAAFRANAGRATVDYAKRYIRLKKEFNKAYSNLMEQKDVIARWKNEEQKGQRTGKIQAMRDKKKLMKYLFTLRKTAFLLERVYFRLLELNEYYEQGHGRHARWNGYTAAKFWREFKNDRDGLAKKMAKFKYILKLYAKRNDNRSVFESMSGGMSDNTDDFFEDPGF